MKHLSAYKQGSFDFQTSIDFEAMPISTYLVQNHKYVLTKREVDLIFHKPIYQEIIRSDAFQRLKKIYFLGAIDYTIDTRGPKPNRRHTRYQHSVGVALLALQYAVEKKLQEHEKVMCVVAALLHDIGHAPLSHSLETVFKKEFGISHHISGERIIKGDVDIGKGLHGVLVKWEVNPFEIMAIIEGVGDSPYKEIFSYSINIDTIEAILRSTTYIKNNKMRLTPPMVMAAYINLNESSMPILDYFWQLKNKVYSELINGKVGVIADFVCQKYMENNVADFKESYYYGTEKQLKDDHVPLFNSLEKLLKNAKEPEVILPDILPGIDQIPCIKRKFYVDENIRADSYQSIKYRYRQEKHAYSLFFK